MAPIKNTNLDLPDQYPNIAVIRRVGAELMIIHADGQTDTGKNTTMLRDAFRDLSES
jgi:uncharacterized protein (DUF927 family)